MNALQTVAHFVGAILIANFISEEWDYRYLWRVPLLLCFALACLRAQAPASRKQQQSQQSTPNFEVTGLLRVYAVNRPTNCYHHPTRAVFPLYISIACVRNYCEENKPASSSASLLRILEPSTERHRSAMTTSNHASTDIRGKRPARPRGHLTSRPSKPIDATFVFSLSPPPPLLLASTLCPAIFPFGNRPRQTRPFTQSLGWLATHG